jgi:cytochrome c oxidase subunit 1
MRPLLVQLWLWFVGMMVMTLPWHYTGLQGQWRRVAAFDYSNPMIASWGPWVIVSLAGGIVLAVSALLFVANLAGLHRRGVSAAVASEFPYAQAVHPPVHVPASLNGFGLWNLLVALLMAGAYGYPIAQFFIDPPPEAVVHRLH